MGFPVLRWRNLAKGFATPRAAAASYGSMGPLGIAPNMARSPFANGCAILALLAIGISVMHAFPAVTATTLPAPTGCHPSQRPVSPELPVNHQCCAAGHNVAIVQAFAGATQTWAAASAPPGPEQFAATTSPLSVFTAGVPEGKPPDVKPLRI